MQLDDPRVATIRSALEHRPARQVPRAAAVGEAAVALVLRPRETIDLLLIKRAEHDADPWSGHMALPGGRRDRTDSDLVATAFRETSEETGVHLARIGRLIGALDEVQPLHPRLPRILIAPYVFVVPPDTTSTPDRREVDAALWIPLPALHDEAAVDSILIDLEEGRRAFPAIRYRDYRIWGLTHRILTQFLDLARSAGL